jgi:hypothetical protein
VPGDVAAASEGVGLDFAHGERGASVIADPCSTPDMVTMSVSDNVLDDVASRK